MDFSLINIRATIKTSQTIGGQENLERTLEHRLRTDRVIAEN